MFYSVGNFRTPSPGDSISSNPEITDLRRWGDEPGYVEVLHQRAGSLNIKRLLLIKENQISQVKEFSAFLCLGRCKILDSLESFLCYASEQSGARILCFLILRLLRGWLIGEWLQQLLLDDVHPVSLPSSLREAVMWCLDGCGTLCWLLRQAVFSVPNIYPAG